MTDNIIFEQPLNERIRTFLRLEFLFNRIDTLLEYGHGSQYRDVISHLIDLVSLFERSDLKQEIIKELERLTAVLSALENSPGIDSQVLDGLLNELDQMIDQLHLTKSSIGQSLRENEFFTSIRQRSTIAGGNCAFDLPAYHYWLQHHSYPDQKQQLLIWFAQFDCVRSAITISLKLIRDSQPFINKTALSGTFQQNLSSSQTYQLIRISVVRSGHYYPEISGGKHRFTVRFIRFAIEQRATPPNDDIDFLLSCCAL